MIRLGDLILTGFAQDDLDQETPRWVVVDDQDAGPCSGAAVGGGVLDDYLLAAGLG